MFLMRGMGTHRSWEQVGIFGWRNEQVDMQDWREAAIYRPKGPAALGRSTSLKPPALPEVGDFHLAPIQAADIRT